MSKVVKDSEFRICCKCNSSDTGICDGRESYSKGSKWERFRIDEKSYNETCQSLTLYLKGDKYFGIEDINKWLKM